DPHSVHAGIVAAVRQTGWMDPHALAVLELDAIVERLSSVTESVYGAELARGLLPSPDPAEVAERQALTSEAIVLYDRSAEPSFAGVADVRDGAARAARGGLLTPGELRQVAVSIEVALEARRRLAGEHVPLLQALAARIESSLATVAETIDRRVDDEGNDLRDDASPQLRRLRTELRRGRERVRTEITRISRSDEIRPSLQETFVT